MSARPGSGPPRRRRRDPDSSTAATSPRSIGGCRRPRRSRQPELPRHRPPRWSRRDQRRTMVPAAGRSGRDRPRARGVDRRQRARSPISLRPRSWQPFRSNVSRPAGAFHHHRHRPACRPGAHGHPGESPPRHPVDRRGRHPAAQPRARRQSWCTAEEQHRRHRDTGARLTPAARSADTIERREILALWRPCPGSGSGARHRGPR